mmetsp:Transcript_71155/g.200767  ORF Transcript_71155/g.200767 Transcript_71155/m.200767 type:complete len:206 (+) Transcript_71155:84-701(+)
MESWCAAVAFDASRDGLGILARICGRLAVALDDMREGYVVALDRFRAGLAAWSAPGRLAGLWLLAILWSSMDPVVRAAYAACTDDALEACRDGAAAIMSSTTCMLTLSVPEGGVAAALSAITARLYLGNVENSRFADAAARTPTPWNTSCSSTGMAMMLVGEKPPWRRIRHRSSDVSSRLPSPARRPARPSGAAGGSGSGAGPGR